MKGNVNADLLQDLATGPSLHLDIKQDFFENLVLYCEEADHAASGGKFRDRALCIVKAALREQRQEASKLYNSYRNLYLDKCYGESKTPLGEWMYFPTDEED